MPHGLSMNSLQNTAYVLALASTTSNPLVSHHGFAFQALLQKDRELLRKSVLLEEAQANTEIEHTSRENHTGKLLEAANHRWMKLTA